MLQKKVPDQSKGLKQFRLNNDLIPLANPDLYLFFFMCCYYYYYCALLSYFCLLFQALTTNMLQFCFVVIPMMLSLSIFNVITDSMLTKSVPASDSGNRHAPNMQKCYILINSHLHKPRL